MLEGICGLALHRGPCPQAGKTVCDKELMVWVGRVPTPQICERDQCPKGTRCSTGRKEEGSPPTKQGEMSLPSSRCSSKEPRL